MAKKMETKKCQYSHCKFPDKIIILSEGNYVIEKGRYYHLPCQCEKNTMLEIIDFWYENIDKDVIFNQLRRLLDRLVYNDGYEAEYILFALKKKAKYLKHPPGLVYAVKDKSVKSDYEFQKRLAEFNKQRNNIPISKSEEPKFTINSHGEKKGFGDIFGGN